MKGGKNKNVPGKKPLHALCYGILDTWVIFAVPGLVFVFFKAPLLSQIDTLFKMSETSDLHLAMSYNKFGSK